MDPIVVAQFVGGSVPGARRRMKDHPGLGDTMTPNAGPAPVNRWAAEHYGFEDDMADPDAALTHPTPSTEAAHRSPTPERPPRRQRTALVAAGVLAASLIAGFGGVAVAADSPGNGFADDRGNGRADIVRFDGDGGRGDNLGGDARGFGRP
jgi:hypothetical protein